MLIQDFHSLQICGLPSPPNLTCHLVLGHVRSPHALCTTQRGRPHPLDSCRGLLTECFASGPPPHTGRSALPEAPQPRPESLSVPGQSPQYLTRPHLLEVFPLPPHYSAPASPLSYSSVGLKQATLLPPQGLCTHCSKSRCSSPPGKIFILRVVF